MVTAGNRGDENSVSMKVGRWYAKALYEKVFENSTTTNISHCILSDKCYKITVTDNGYEIMKNFLASFFAI